MYGRAYFLNNDDASNPSFIANLKMRVERQWEIQTDV